MEMMLTAMILINQYFLSLSKIRLLSNNIDFFSKYSINPTLTFFFLKKFGKMLNTNIFYTPAILFLYSSRASSSLFLLSPAPGALWEG